jgi:hypothetical protein
MNVEELMVPRQIRVVIVLSVLVSAIGARPTFAGPPLLCHPFDVNGAQSLPWGTGASWSAERADYDVSRLVADTEALLTPSMPVIVRMETLRRAAIYASRDQKVASALLTTLTNRVHAANRTKDPGAFAYLDAAYLIEALRQVGMLGESSAFRDRAPVMRELVKDLDGYALMQKSLLVQPGDPALEFAAALIASDRNRAAYQAHAARARAGAARDPLLARNLKQLT